MHMDSHTWSWLQLSDFAIVTQPGGDVQRLMVRFRGCETHVNSCIQCRTILYTCRHIYIYISIYIFVYIYICNTVSIDILERKCVSWPDIFEVVVKDNKPDRLASAILGLHVVVVVPRVHKCSLRQQAQLGSSQEQQNQNKLCHINETQSRNMNKPCCTLADMRALTLPPAPGPPRRKHSANGPKYS